MVSSCTVLRCALLRTRSSTRYHAKYQVPCEVPGTKYRHVHVYLRRGDHTIRTRLRFIYLLSSLFIIILVFSLVS